MFDYKPYHAEYTSNGHHTSGISVEKPDREMSHSREDGTVRDYSRAKGGLHLPRLPIPVRTSYVVAYLIHALLARGYIHSRLRRDTQMGVLP